MGMMAGRAFVDTNILLRATIVQFPFHQQAKVLIGNEIRVGTELWISWQVVREYIQQSTRQQVFMNPMSIEQLEAEIVGIRALFRIADETEPVMEQLLTLIKKYPTAGKQVHDANIVATMLVYGIDTLLTLNVSDFERFQDQIKLITLPKEHFDAD